MGFKIISNGWTNAFYILVRLWVAPNAGFVDKASSKVKQLVQYALSGRAWVTTTTGTTKTSQICVFNNKNKLCTSVYLKQCTTLHSENKKQKKRRSPTKIMVPNLNASTSTALSFDSSLGFNLSNVWAIRESGWTKHEWWSCPSTEGRCSDGGGNVMLLSAKHGGTTGLWTRIGWQRALMPNMVRNSCEKRKKKIKTEKALRCVVITLRSS